MANTEKRYVLWGIPPGESGAINERVLLTNATLDKISRIRPLAEKKGFHSFRILEEPDTSKPLDWKAEVTKAIKKGVFRG